MHPSPTPLRVGVDHLRCRYLGSGSGPLYTNAPLRTPISSMPWRLTQVRVRIPPAPVPGMSLALDKRTLLSHCEESRTIGPGNDVVRDGNGNTRHLQLVLVEGHRPQRRSNHVDDMPCGFGCSRHAKTLAPKLRRLQSAGFEGSTEGMNRPFIHVCHCAQSRQPSASGVLPGSLSRGCGPTRVTQLTYSYDKQLRPSVARIGGQWHSCCLRISCCAARSPALAEVPQFGLPLRSGHESCSWIAC